MKTFTDFCHQKLKKIFAAGYAEGFEAFYSSFCNTNIDNPQITDFIRFSFLLNVLENLVKKHGDHFSGLLQPINNAYIFLYSALNIHQPAKIYVETVRQLYDFEQHASDKALDQLGFSFSQMVAKFHKVETPTWEILAQFKIALQKYNKIPELKFYFDPIISSLENVLPKNSHETPLRDTSLKISPAISQ